MISNLKGYHELKEGFE